MAKRTAQAKDRPEGRATAGVSLPGNYSPSEWEQTTVGDLIASGALYVKNGFPQGDHNRDGAGVPHLRPFNVTGHGTIDLAKVKSVAPPDEESPYWVRRGDVIFNNTNSEDLVGKTAYFEVDGRFVLSNHMTMVRVEGQSIVDPYWLSKLFHYLWGLGLFRALCRRHVNQASVSLERLKTVPLTLPAIAEQRAVAHILRTLQDAKEAAEKAIAAARQLKASLMQHLFTYGPVPIGQARQVALKETEVGLIPEAWEVVSLGAVTEFLQYGTSSRCHSEAVGVPVLRIPNVVGDEIDVRDLKYIEMEASERKKYVLKAGDLLFVRTNGRREYIGRCAVFKDQPEGALFASYLIRGRLRRDQVLPEFVQLYSTMPAGRANLSGRASGAADGKFNINTQILKTVMLPRPSIEEQTEIVRAVGAVSQKKAEARKNADALDRLFESSLKALMSGRLRPDGFEAADGSGG